MLFCHIFSLCLFNTCINNSLVFYYIFYFFTLFVCFLFPMNPGKDSIYFSVSFPFGVLWPSFLWVACLAALLWVAFLAACLPMGGCLAGCENLFTGRKRGPATLPSEACVLPTKLNSWFLFFHLQLYVLLHFLCLQLSLLHC